MDGAQIWLDKAQEDFDTAEFNKASKKFLYAAFLYQQATEKALKAVLIKQNKGLPKAHDCFFLAKKADARDIVVQHADIVSPYYFRTLYPDTGLVELNQDDIERIAIATKEVLAWCKEQFQKK